MSDIALVWDQSRQSGDFALSGTQLLSGADLPTAILASITSNRLAQADDVIPDLTTDRRGWWGDNTFGSRIWLLSRTKRTPDILQRTKDYLVEALQWLIDDGVVVKFDVETNFVGNQLHAGVTAFRSDGTNVAQSFSWVWGVLTPS
jgi:phage gp46-like protein